MNIDFGAILQASLILAGFLITVFTIVPKEVEYEFSSFATLLIPPHVLFLITAMLAAVNNPLAILLFIISSVFEIIFFIIFVIILSLVARYVGLFAPA